MQPPPSQERLRPYEWAAAAVAGLGVLGLGLSAEPDHLDHPTAPAAHIVLAFLGLVALLGESVGVCILASCCTASGGGRRVRDVGITPMIIGPDPRFTLV